LLCAGTQGSQQKRTVLARTAQLACRGLLRGFRLHVRLAKRPQLLFKSTLLRHASLLLLAWSPALIWLLRSQDNRDIIDGLGPGE